MKQNSLLASASKLAVSLLAIFALSAPSALFGAQRSGSTELRVVIPSAASIVITDPGADNLANFNFGIRSDNDGATGLVQLSLLRTSNTTANAKVSDTLLWGCYSNNQNACGNRSFGNAIQTARVSLAQTKTATQKSAGTLGWKLADDNFEDSDAKTNVTLTLSGI